MELHFPSFYALFSFLLFIFMVFLILKRSSTKKNLPPGPWKLPIIGNVHNFLGSLPHQSLHILAKKFGPIMHLKLGEVNTIVVSSVEIAKEVTKTHDIIFASRPSNPAVNLLTYNSSDLSFAPYGESWRQMRKICVLELLSSKRVQSFRRIREEETLNVLRSISSSEGSKINLSKLLFSYTYKVISRAAFGEMRKEHEEFAPLVKQIIGVVTGFSIVSLFPSIKFVHNIGGMRARIEKLHQECNKILDAIIKNHKLERQMLQNKVSDEGGNDLLNVLLSLQEEQNQDCSFLTVENVKGVILDMFVAGSETSSIVAEWAMSEMMRNPKVMEKVQVEVRRVFGKKGYVDEVGLGELNYLKLVIKETLRLHPPVPLLLPRESQAQCEINGYCIPIKHKIYINVWSIGRDPSYWTDAENFIPERFSDSEIDFKGANFELIPFGAGRRICPGITFSMINVEFLLANLLFYFDWKLPDKMEPRDIDMTEAALPSVRRKNDLNLIPVICNHLPAEA